jgi:hypothetical protein
MKTGIFVRRLLAVLLGISVVIAVILKILADGLVL